MTPMRSYEIEETATGWKLTMYEDDEEIGAAVGGPDDYEWIEEQALEFVTV